MYHPDPSDELAFYDAECRDDEPVEPDFEDEDAANAIAEAQASKAYTDFIFEILAGATRSAYEQKLGTRLP